MGVDEVSASTKSSTSLSGILLSAVAVGHGALDNVSAVKNSFPGLCSIE